MFEYADFPYGTKGGYNFITPSENPIRKSRRLKGRKDEYRI
jgi:hypothetical protein